MGVPLQVQELMPLAPEAVGVSLTVTCSGIALVPNTVISPEVASTETEATYLVPTVLLQLSSEVNPDD